MDCYFDRNVILEKYLFTLLFNFKRQSEILDISKRTLNPVFTCIVSEQTKSTIKTHLSTR